MSLADQQSPENADRFFNDNLESADKEVFDAIKRELGRQQDQIELIASENIVSKAVLESQGSVLTNKYAEGYPGRRYYGGCEFVDVAEDLACDRAKKLFGCEFANVQPHSGSQANQGVMMALAMQVVTPLIGGGGLGRDVFNALNTSNTGYGLAAGTGIVLLAIILDRLSQAWTANQRKALGL